ncbi:MAG: SRPBCC domain-containing protein [Rhodothermales bacterium]|nr:SRPBCC domain-containing protein [Rhodothermales bacterium]
MIDTTDIIVLQHFYNHPVETVWQAITDQDAISSWFIKAVFKPEVGSDYTFTHESTTISGTVLIADRPHQLQYTWIVGDSGVETIVTWTLVPTDAGTEIKLVHSGIDAYGDSAMKMFESFNQGWAHCASELEAYLANGSE